MISPKDIQVTKSDLMFFTTFFVVANIIDAQLLQTKLFEEVWMNKTVAFLLGVALHGLLTNKISSALNDQLEITNRAVQASVYDLVKFSTIFSVQQAVHAWIENRPIVFDREWMMRSGLTYAGYLGYNLVIGDMLPSVGAMYQPMLNDVVKVGLGEITREWVMQKELNKSSLISTFSIAVGIVTFHLVTKRLL